MKNRFAMAHELLPEGTEFPAFSMADVFKPVPTQTAAKLDAKIKDDESVGIDHVERCAAILEAELTMRMNEAGGQVPVLVAMVKQAFKWLTGVKKDKRIADVVVG